MIFFKLLKLKYENNNVQCIKISFKIRNVIFKTNISAYSAEKILVNFKLEFQKNYHIREQKWDGNRRQSNHHLQPDEKHENSSEKKLL